MISKIENQVLRQVFNLMKLTFVIVSLVAGIDKFTNILSHWEKYIDPSIAHLLPFSTTVFMMVVGIIEIIAGLIVFIKPTIGGYIVTTWLTTIALSLLLSFNYADGAIRNLVMAISAFSMARLSKIIA